MGLVAVIQEHRKLTSQPFTLAAIVEEALAAYYDILVEEGAINDKQSHHFLLVPWSTTSRPYPLTKKIHVFVFVLLVAGCSSNAPDPVGNTRLR
jgi:hypothetical protein